ncbi:MAG: T9SS type A sorting domain-containing protein [Ignavibacteriales bacterium]|nr:T9SS type A sorting domain-containing protein [Ignavibacteriales bacterium]
MPDSTKTTRISVTDLDPYVPVPLDDDTARTKNLEIQQGGYMYFEAGGVLVVHGTETIQNLGKIYLGSGTIICLNNITFFNGGTFHADSGTMQFSGVTWDNKSGATFDPGTSTVIFNGSGSQTLQINDTSNFSFYNLQLLTQGTVSIDGDLVVRGDCYLAAGCTLNVPTGSSFIVNGSFTGDGVITGDGSFTPLPVQIVSYSVVARRNDVILRWTTAGEVNNYGFEIERRKISLTHTDTRGFESQNDGVNTTSNSPWGRIGFVAGSGTSTSPREYSFIDHNLPAGRYGYRIKQLDFDGSFAYYAATEVEIGFTPGEFSLRDNYPNPFNPSTTIEFIVPENGRVLLRVFNLAGEEVATLFDGEAEGGRPYQVLFDATNLPSGVYFSQLRFGSRLLTKSMILLK